MGAVSITNGIFLSQDELGATLTPYVYVCDQGNNRIDVFTWYGAPVILPSGLTYFGGYGTGNGLFNSPYDVVTDGANVFVSDSKNNLIQIFTMTGVFVGQFGGFGSANGQFNSPLGVCVDNNFIYVADNQNFRFQIFSKISPYNFIQSVGSYGTGTNQFIDPTDCSVDDVFFYIDDAGGHGWLAYPKAYPTNVLYGILPLIKFSATLAERSFALTAHLPLIKFYATMAESFVGNLIAKLPKVEFDAKMHSPLVFSLDATLPLLKFTSTIAIPSLFTLKATLPLVEFDATIVENGQYNLKVTMPMLRFTALYELATSGAYFTIVMNTENFAVTEYTNYQFDSMASFNGKQYGVGANGLIRLDGANDMGTKIQGFARFSQMDLHKRVVTKLVDAYLTGKISGKVGVKIIQESQGDFLYTIEDVIGRLKAYRVKAPKNMRDRFASYEITNLDGSPIEIDELSVIATAMPLRVR
jgi:hypothetical protein